MRSQIIFIKISKVLGKLLLGIFLVLVFALAGIHLPPVQKKITASLENYLSDKIGTQIEIENIGFSVWGNINIQGLSVWDPDNTKILSAEQIKITFHVSDLLRGRFLFDTLRLAGVDFRLIERAEELNIQFIVDAFQSVEASSTASNPVTLSFTRVQLDSIHFEFISQIKGITVDVIVGNLEGYEAAFITNPNKIKADRFLLNQAIVNIFQSGSQESSSHIPVSQKNDVFRLLSLNADLGIDFDIQNLIAEKSGFSLHHNLIATTPKFDPDHLQIQNINFNLSEIVVNEDSLSADLLSLSGQLPHFKLEDARFELQWNRKQFDLRNLHLASSANQVDATLKSSTLPNEADGDNLEINLLGKINPKSLAYFLPDSLLNPIINWNSIEAKLEGTYNQSQGFIKTLLLKTSNSYLLADGQINEAFNYEKINWKNISINTTLGPDFKKIITPLAKGFTLPEVVNIRAQSSGDLKRIRAKGNVNTNWGNLQFEGFTTPQVDNTGFHVNLIGQQFDLGKWVDVPLGPSEFSLAMKGIIGTDQNLEINGSIAHLEILDQSISNIVIESQTSETNSIIKAVIGDPAYRSEINAEILFSESLTINSMLQLENFSLGALVNWDSTLSVSGGINSTLTLNDSTLEGSVEGKRILFQNQSTKYLLDTLTFYTTLSPTGSKLEYYSDNEHGKWISNFDIRDSQNSIQKWVNTTFHIADTSNTTTSRTMAIDLEANNASLFQLLGIDVDEVTHLKLTGEFDEQAESSSFEITSGKFNGYGLSLDTLHTIHYARPDSLSTHMIANNVYYDSVALGHANLDIQTKGEIIESNLIIANDSLALFGLTARILPTDSGTFLYPDKLLFFDEEYNADSNNSILIKNNNWRFNHFNLSAQDSEIKLNGDPEAFDISLKNINLTPLNYLIAHDTTVINKGVLTGSLSYESNVGLTLNAIIDSLILYNSEPVTITGTATRDGNFTPFEFMLANKSNEINLKGQYSSTHDEVDAFLKLEVNNPELFTFLVSEYIDKINGTLRGETTIRGHIKKPTVQGYLQFLNVGVTTKDPKTIFKIPDNRVLIDDSIIHVNNFTLVDEANSPLQIDGRIDYRTLSYNLQLKARDYALINTPDSASGTLKGRLVIDSDTKINGRKKDATINAKLTVKDATKLTFVAPQEDIKLLKDEGIVEFVDATSLPDSIAHEQSIALYDSLLARLPDFTLTSTVKIEKDAVIRISIDEDSGDYIETSGEAALELGYDRTGNLKLAGNYTVNKGIYSLSFYNLVKKNFTLLKGSSINWNGSPKNGDLSIKAVHTVESNSIGLIGNEIGENEKSVYERALDYEIGININGTIEKPVISFSLDLPQKEKASYPVLANKLDRLKQPEYMAELNKQVFGLLVLGGFLPESSSSDISSSTIATTALSNSVNNLLASQLNRFASQYIKNVNIDVGIQSYSDYSTPGGKTQTAMDFRVSKSIMNDRLSFEVGGDFNLNQDQSGTNTGKNYRGDFAIIYDLTGKGDKQLKLFNNQTYDIIYQEIRNTGISLVFIREFESKERKNNRK